MSQFATPIQSSSRPGIRTPIAPLARSSGASPSAPSAAVQDGGNTPEILMERLNKARERHQRMHEQGIRWQSERDRHLQEEQEACEAAKTAFQTSDPNELRAIDAAKIAEASEMVEEFVTIVSSVAERLTVIAKAISDTQRA